LYLWRRLQTEYDSTIKREIYYKQIISKKDTIIEEQEKDNTQLRITLAKVEPSIIEERKRNVELKDKNNKLQLGLGGAILALIIETIILIK
jgi:hypothetical protein